MSNSYTSYSHLPLLNEIEEIELAKAIENGGWASIELRNGNVSSKRQDFLLSEINNAKQAKCQMVLANSGLVISIAKMFQNRGIDLEDLIQEGHIGLIKAVERFDYHQGFRFSTYAKWWIRESISRSISNQSRMIRLPVHIEMQMISLFRTKQSLTQNLLRFPNIGELAEATNLPEEKVTKLLSLSHRCYSLEAICECNDTDLLETIKDEDNVSSPTITSSLYFQKRFVESILACLPEIQCLILKYKFGMMDGFLHTTLEISKILNLSSHQVKHFEKIALQKLSKIVNRIEASDYYID